MIMLTRLLPALLAISLHGLRSRHALLHLPLIFLSLFNIIQILDRHKDITVGLKPKINFIPHPLTKVIALLIICLLWLKNKNYWIIKPITIVESIVINIKMNQIQT